MNYTSYQRDLTVVNFIKNMDYKKKEKYYLDRYDLSTQLSKKTQFNICIQNWPKDRKLFAVFCIPNPVLPNDFI